MPEKLSLPEINPPPVTSETPQSPILGPDAGAIDLGHIVKRSGEIREDVADMGRIAYHGIRAAIADKRRDWATDRVDKMDHKDAFYAFTSATAKGEATIPPTVQPVSFPERFVDRRIHEAAWKKGAKKAKQNEVDGAYDKKSVRAVPDHVQQHTEHVDELFRTGVITAEEWQKEKADIRDVTQAFRQDPPSDRALNFARTEGRATKADTRQRKRHVKKAYKRGHISATERHVAKQDISATPRAFENREQRKVRRATERSTQDLDRITAQPVLGRWRKWRRKEGEKDSDRHNDRAIKHVRAQYFTKRELAARRAARP